MRSEKPDFARRAKLLRPYFRQELRQESEIIPPALIHEYLGTPSSGKTTLIKESDKFWKRQGFRTYTPQEGAEAIRYTSRKTPLYNYATAYYAAKILIEVSTGRQYEHVMFDRCMFDAYTWMKYWFKKGKLSAERMRVLQEAFLVNAELIDIAFMVLCDPETAVKRETKNELSDQLGQYTNKDTISLLIECNRESYEELKPRFPNLYIIDTTDMDEKTMVQYVTDLVLNGLEEKILAASA